MIIHLKYADKTITEEHEAVIIYDNDDMPICKVTNNVITVFNPDDHYSESPSEIFDHLKIF